MGAMDYIKSMMEAATNRRPKKLKQFQTVALRVLMDCEGCERKVRKSLEKMKGLRSLVVDRKQFKVTVTGYVDPKKVLKTVKRTRKTAEMWPYKPYDLVYYPYATQVYDKKAPAGYVRNVDTTFPNPEKTEEGYTSLFSEDNPNACSIM